MGYLLPGHFQKTFEVRCVDETTQTSEIKASEKMSLLRSEPNMATMYRGTLLLRNRASLGPCSRPVYRGTSLIRNRASLGTYSRPMPRGLRWS